MLKALLTPMKESENVCSTQQDDENLALDMLVCGEVLLVKDEWRVCFSCSFCGKVVEKLETLLQHALETHLSDVSAEELKVLLESIKIREETLEEQFVVAAVEEKGEPEVNSDVDSEYAPVVKVEVQEQQEFAQSFDKFLTDEKTESQDSASHATANDDECDLDESSSTSLTPSNITSDRMTEFEVVFLKNPSSVQNSKSSKRDSYPCPVCKQSFQRRYELDEHAKIHRDYKPYPCDFCEAHFKDLANLKVHRYRHLGIKPHPCKQCGKAFTSSTELKLHVRSHTGERPYICPECDKGFRSVSHLIAHRRRHSNDRPCLCTTCGKRFFDTKLLRDHMISHTKERDFTCNQCNTTFTRRKALSQHMKLHSGVKEYVCQYCPKRFAQRAGMHCHMKTHNKKE